MASLTPLSVGEGGEVVERLGLRRGVVDGPGRAGVVALPHRLDVELLVRRRRFVTFEHVDHDHRDVVAPAAAVRRGDQLVGGELRIGDRRDDLVDLAVVDLVGQPVRAEHEAVAAHDRQRPRVDADRGVDAEGPGDDVAPRVGARLVVGDQSGVDELLDVVVVHRHPAQPVVTEQVGARVTDVDEGEALSRRGVGRSGGEVVAVRGRRVDDEQTGERGAHALLVDVGGGRGEDLAVGVDDGRQHVVERQRGVAETALQQLDGERARHLAGLVPAHAVGHREEVVLDEDAVLVLLADPSRVGRPTPAEGRGHWASITV